jgi:hypothetical protein
MGHSGTFSDRLYRSRDKCCVELLVLHGLSTSTDPTQLRDVVRGAQPRGRKFQNLPEKAH